jgi:phthiocerol/phenolphthiocerol synthesis type-I polyketide synthase E
MHPAVIESRDFWLQTADPTALRVGSEVAEDFASPGVDELGRVSSTLTALEATEIDDARRRLRRSIEEILLAALGRTIATTVGDGTVTVDLGGPGRSVLKPDVDLRRTVGWFTTLYPVSLRCSTEKATSARQRLEDVHDRLNAVPHYGIGYGLLRYLYAPTARLLEASRSADIHFAYVGTIPDLSMVSTDDAPVQFDTDTAMPVREATPGLGHAIELRVYRSAGVLHLDWWYDSRRVESAMAQSLADEFSKAVMDLVREAIAEEELDSAGDDMALVDLSSTDTSA